MVLLLAAALLALGVAACGSDSDDESSEATAEATAGEAGEKGEHGAVEEPRGKGTVVKVELGESSPNKYFVKLDKKKVQAGKVTFQVDNVGELYHEMIVYLSDSAPGDIPVDKAENKAELDEDSEIGEAAYASPPRGDEDHHIRPERGVDMTLTLKPGKYILLCDINGHYGDMKQYVGFTVE